MNDDLQGFKTKLNKAKTAKSQQNITEREWLDIKSRIKRILNNITLIKAQGVEVAENKRPVLKKTQSETDLKGAAERRDAEENRYVAKPKITRSQSARKLTRQKTDVSFTDSDDELHSITSTDDEDFAF